MIPSRGMPLATPAEVAVAFKRSLGRRHVRVTCSRSCGRSWTHRPRRRRSAQAPWLPLRLRRGRGTAAASDYIGGTIQAVADGFEFSATARQVSEWAPSTLTTLGCQARSRGTQASSTGWQRHRARCSMICRHRPGRRAAAQVRALPTQRRLPQRSSRPSSKTPTSSPRWRAESRPAAGQPLRHQAANAILRRRPSVIDNRQLIRAQSAVHRWIYRLTGGVIGGRIGRAPVLLLTTQGRRTGRVRTTPLLYVRDGSRLAIVASNAGNDKSPGWWLNLQASPEAQVQVGRRKMKIKARVADPDERARLWPLACAQYRTYAKYQEKTHREIPVVVLEPEQAAASG